MFKFNCYVDGGFNGHAYGSYRIQFSKSDVIHKTFSLPDATTSNQAEYLSLIKLLALLIELKKKYEKVWRQFDFTIYTDSKLVYNQVIGKYATRNERLKELNKTAKELYNNLYTNVKLVWTPREMIFDKLGH